MGQRLDLHALLLTICPNAYFQPPADVQMEYPAIVYELDRFDTKFADDRPYAVTRHYSLQLISRDPDDAKLGAISALPMCAHERFFVADNLNHNVFSIFF